MSAPFGDYNHNIMGEFKLQQPIQWLATKGTAIPWRELLNMLCQRDKTGPYKKSPQTLPRERQGNEKGLTSFQIWFASLRRQVPRDSSDLLAVDHPGCPSAVGPCFLTTLYPSTTLFKHPKNTLLEQDTTQQKRSVGVGSSVCNGQNFCN